MWLKQMPLGILRATTNTKATGPVVKEAAVEADAIRRTAEEEEEDAKSLIISNSTRVWQIAWIIL